MSHSDPIFYGKPLTFSEKAHRYTWDGKAIPSVTTILNRLAKPLLIQWAADQAVEHIRTNCRNHALPDCYDVDEEDLEAARKAHAATRDKAGDIGSLVHKHAQAIFQGAPLPADELPTQAAVAIAAFKDWHDTLWVEEREVERRIMSLQRFYAGTTDFFGRLDGRWTIMDFKTSKGVYDEHYLQVGAYLFALIEELGIPFDEPIRCGLIHINKDTGEVTPHWFEYQSPIGTAHLAAWARLADFDRAMRNRSEELKAAKKAAKAA